LQRAAPNDTKTPFVLCRYRMIMARWLIRDQSRLGSRSDVRHDRRQVRMSACAALVISAAPRTPCLPPAASGPNTSGVYRLQAAMLVTNQINQHSTPSHLVLPIGALSSSLLLILPRSSAGWGDTGSTKE
jgi:hypothetical protein